jgi:hypothetical protein
MRDSAYRGRFEFRKKFIFIPFLVAGILALISYIVMQLWNHLLPDILHTGTIDFWQAMELFILAKILFGFGPGGRGGGAPWMRHRMERFKNMSPEEKQRFKEEMRSRCGWKDRYYNGPDFEQPAAEASKPVE